MTVKESMKTIPAYIAKLNGDRMFSEEEAMMAVMASIPIIIIFLAFSNYFLGGNAVYSASKE
jgi:multiple sugar transport system permease protein